MPPEFALAERKLGETERFVAQCVEGYVTKHSRDDHDDDPDSIVEDIEDTIREFLNDPDCSPQSLPCRDEADINSYNEIRRRTISLIKNCQRSADRGSAAQNTILTSGSLAISANRKTANQQGVSAFHTCSNEQSA